MYRVLHIIIRYTEQDNNKISTNFLTALSWKVVSWARLIPVTGLKAVSRLENVGPTVWASVIVRQSQLRSDAEGITVIYHCICVLFLNVWERRDPIRDMYLSDTYPVQSCALLPYITRPRRKLITENWHLHLGRYSFSSVFYFF